MRRLIVVGASGMIGRRLVERASSSVVTLTTSRGPAGELRLDLSHPRDFDYAQFGPGDVVAMAGGVSSPDECSRNRANAWTINVEGTIAFIEAAVGAGARAIFLSSDTVYGESAEPVDESATCAPIGDYAIMKHAVERHFQGHPAVRSLRVSLAFSAEDHFTRYLARCAEGGEVAEVFHPFDRAIVHRDDVADAVIALGHRWEEFAQSPINVGGPEFVSRMAFAEMVRNAAFPRLRIRTVEPGPQFFHNRPRMIRMQSPNLPRLLGRPAQDLRLAIRVELCGG